MLYLPSVKGEPCSTFVLDYWLECDVARAYKKGRRVKIEDVENGCATYKQAEECRLAKAEGK